MAEDAPAPVAWVTDDAVTGLRGGIVVTGPLPDDVLAAVLDTLANLGTLAGLDDLAPPDLA